ncbi:MAG: hypothetical protein COW19_09185 [Zetaproteobacteria bacterium CG12_big_fil_rev_8_21_14_0_65_55_1124]|nr:MAG: hypothetical protein AUJ58_04955 [Zetaproteobacteria bacterium CG1_02_55_237]PIS18632.1 MAG: hypothetical protein COT53_09890 [Zetaproteobacteria bacterium CG08_land_8_20_14_0_20_55_17]PIW42238.1 MAG: hypothetical protein COW19_09185 [Zetaproteobacteria bacterium CG12_big_fil_rev_8_21_14_0_65_55_1124]PIY51370.1 MAG: hypothetical protein COZ01_11390 [Zetaproteobacteria bacterium CG_4_10_14_0_8_um_filter_55_43]PIZ38653.1 MAG: hypothetical protein COY36_05710 [Zetaproteobacteria bacterium 
MPSVSIMTSRDLLFRLADDKPFAFRNGKPIYPSRLYADLQRTERLINPATGDILVTCKGRYEFSLALLASWRSGKTVILPPNLHQATLEHIRRQHTIANEFGDGFSGFAGATVAKDDDKPFELQFSQTHPALTIYTSGSTGAPKPVHKSIGNIFAEAFALKQVLAWPDKPLVASVPPHHLYGLTFSVLLPWVLGIPMVNECPLHAEEVIDAIDRVDAGTLISVPVHLRSLLEQKISCKPIMTISSASVLDRDIAIQWQEKSGREIVEIYGSSETGVIAYRRQLSDAGWIPFPDVRIGTSEHGLLQVASPFIHNSEGNIFQTQDRVSLLEGRRFQLHGRADSIVKIAGKRVSLLAVEEAIKRCRGVVDAAVTAVPVQGHIRDMAIWAAVATGEEGDVDARTIRTQLLPQLDGIKMPRRIVTMKQLPREENGKLSREKLMALFHKDALP